MTETNRYVKAYRKDKVPFVVNQSIWFEGEAKFADIILPACTNFERWDISEFASCSGYIPDNYTQANHRIITLQKKCIEPLGESKSDYEIFAALCERLGVYDDVHHGRQDEYWTGSRRTSTPPTCPSTSPGRSSRRRATSCVPFPKDHKSTPALRWFAEGRKRDTPDWGPAPWDTVGMKGLQTTSGKIEFVAQQPQTLRGQRHGRSRAPGHGPAVHPELGRPPHRRSCTASTRCRWCRPHPRFSFHTMGDGKESWMNEVKDHRVLSRRPLLLDHAAQHAGRRGPGHQRWRPHPGLQRPGFGHPRRPGHRAGASGTVHSYESCADYDPLGEPGRVAGPRRMREHPHQQRLITPTSSRHGQQFLPHRGGEMGGSNAK